MWVGPVWTMWAVGKEATPHLLIWYAQNNNTSFMDYLASSFKQITETNSGMIKIAVDWVKPGYTGI